MLNWNESKSVYECSIGGQVIDITPNELDDLFLAILDISMEEVTQHTIIGRCLLSLH